MLAKAKDMVKSTGAWLDGKLAKFVSRKLMVLIFASSFFWMERLGEDNWTYLALVYIGVQGLVDGFIKWKSGA